MGSGHRNLRWRGAAYEQWFLAVHEIWDRHVQGQSLAQGSKRVR
jgi:hypothetical protein